jgi:hypothetical protein
VVGREGEVGITVEHSPAEAVPIAMLMNYCLDFLYVASTSWNCRMSHLVIALFNSGLVPWVFGL